MMSSLEELASEVRRFMDYAFLIEKSNQMLQEVMSDLVQNHDRRVTELLTRNNELLEKCRGLEAELSQYRKTSESVFLAEQQKYGSA